MPFGVVENRRESFDGRANFYKSRTLKKLIMKECVLVAGGAGYIGTHTAVELVEAGYDVVIVDNLSNSEMKAVEGVREITGRNVPFERVC